MKVDRYIQIKRCYAYNELKKIGFTEDENNSYNLKISGVIHSIPSKLLIDFDKDVICVFTDFPIRFCNVLSTDYRIINLEDFDTLVSDIIELCEISSFEL